MAQIYICIVWHMHQPFYKDLMSGEYKLPWTRLHALKDYYGMVRILEEFPGVHQTFNLVPSMLVQIEEYAADRAADPFLRCALKPAEDLSDEEQDFILRYFFQANAHRLIRRYPRYGELYDAWLAADRNARRARQFFGVRAFRDLQVLSQLAWFDEEFLEKDQEVRALVTRGRDYTLEDQALMGHKQTEITGRVLPVYKEFAARGQIEISSTPFYHPILPLLCDSNIAEVSHPYVPLPSRFEYPADARQQLERTREYFREQFGGPTAGLWPSEGSVSDETLAIAAELGFQWIASDNGVLSRTLNAPADPWLTYQPYVWRQGGREIRAIFRDHQLSDLVGFVYSRMGAVEAAHHFLGRIRENCRGILTSGRDALVPVILDGENAWEHYELNGRPFLRELYRLIEEDSQLSALTVSEALTSMEPQALDHIFPGSWIGANFDVWIGFEEDNKAWECLLRARQTFDRVVDGPEGAALAEDRRRLASEELLIAEGSDWCWWYGPHHHSENRPEFDHLYRAHLANVYRALELDPPDELSRPILKVSVSAMHEAPSAPIRPTIDGEVTSYFEWMGAGYYRVDERSGAMHGQRYLIRELHYGGDGQNLFLRIDFEENAAQHLPGMTARVRLESSKTFQATIRFREGGAKCEEEDCAVEAAYRKVLELRFPLRALGLSGESTVRVQVSLWENGLPVDALPPDGWLTVSTAEPRDWPL